MCVKTRQKTYNLNLTAKLSIWQKPLKLAVFLFYYTCLQDCLQKLTWIFSCIIRSSVEEKNKKQAVAYKNTCVEIALNNMFY